METYKMNDNKAYDTKLTLLSYHLKFDFTVPNSLTHELEEYRLVYWSAAYLYKRLMLNLEEKTGFNWYIDRQDIMYQVIMQNCSIDQIHDFAINEPDYQIRISFRRARKHWNLPATAIIKMPAPRKGLIDLRDSEGNYDHA
jgi:hypothetical protein